MENRKPESQSAPPSDVLRALRTKNGWTLADVSRRTGLTISTLSKLETGKIALTYDKMMRIATGLNIDIGVLFAMPTVAEAPASAPVPLSGRRSITRADEGRVVEQRNFTQHYPAAEFLHKQLVPIIVDVKARSRAEYGELLRHPGEEYVLVTEGAIEIHTEFYAPVRLEAGDSMYFDSGMAHGYIAAAPGRCRMLSVSSTAEWGSAQAEHTDIDRAIAVVQPRVVRAG